MAYFLRRTGASLLTLFIAVVVVFLGVRALPGGPAAALSAETSSPQVLAEVRKEYGLDKPLPAQFGIWIWHALQGNLGNSPRTGLAVSDLVAGRIPISLELAVLAILISLVIGLPLGVLAAVRRGSVIDYVSGTTALLGLSVPHFWIGILLIIGLAVHLQVLPASGFVPLTDPASNLAHMIMPAFVLGIGIAAIVMRQMRASMLESLGSDYVRTARAKGMSEWRVVGIHAMRNSLTTVLTVIGLQLGTLISGVVITEEIFVIPGMGRLTLDSVFNRDYPTLQAVVIIIAAAYIIVNLLTDLAYSLLNPRVRVTGAST